jgi:hypothetical protein
MHDSESSGAAHKGSAEGHVHIVQIDLAELPALTGVSVDPLRQVHVRRTLARHSPTKPTSARRRATAQSLRNPTALTAADKYVDLSANSMRWHASGFGHQSDGGSARPAAPFTRARLIERPIAEPRAAPKKANNGVSTSEKPWATPIQMRVASKATTNRALAVLVARLHLTLRPVPSPSVRQCFPGHYELSSKPAASVSPFQRYCMYASPCSAANRFGLGGGVRPSSLLAARLRRSVPRPKPACSRRG